MHLIKLLSSSTNDVFFAILPKFAPFEVSLYTVYSITPNW